MHLQSIKKWGNFIPMSLMCIVTIIILIALKQHKPSIDSSEFSAPIKQLQSQLTQLQHQLTHTENPDLTAMNTQFMQLKSLIKELKTSNEQEINQFLKENHSTLNNKLESIQTTLNALNQKQHPVQFLTKTALPFELVSIDSIQQMSLVSVIYNYKVIPLEKDDSLAGWTVARVDFGKQIAEFVNRKKEHVIVTLEHDEDEEHA